MAMTLYKKHLQELETRDINSLKKKMADMKTLKAELAHDLEIEQ
jgi:hypothetical protein